MSKSKPPEVVHPEQDLEQEVARLNKIVRALMDRAERTSGVQSSEFDLLQKTVLLENQVRERTRALEEERRLSEMASQALRRTQENMAREIQERKAIQSALESEQAAQRALILQLEDANNRVLQSEKLASIGQLAAGVAHEINNPISYVASNLETLQRYVTAMDAVLEAYSEAEPSISDADGMRSRVAKAKKASDLEYLRSDINSLISESLDGAMRVRKIVQDLKDFSRDGKSSREFVDLQSLVESTLSVARNEIKYKADVVCNFGPVPPVECVPTQMSQVLLNLLINAAQSIAGHGSITIATHSDEQFARISVSDTGCGIPPEILPRIFDPFFTTKPVGAGTGLGLSVSYGIIEKHGGRLSVQSQVGEGTVFTIELPFASADSPPESVEQQAGSEIDICDLVMQ